MQQKKFSTMLTLKIINVFLADSSLRESRSAEIEKIKGREEDKRKGGGGGGGKVETRRLSTGRVEERGEHQHGKRLGPVRQCTSASTAEGRAATLHPQTLPQGGRDVAEEVVRRRGEEKEGGGGVRRRREEVEPMVVSAHKLQIDNKKAQGGDRTPTPGRREKRREGSGVKRGEVEEGKRFMGKEGKRREEERNRGKDTSTRDSLRQ